MCQSCSCSVEDHHQELSIKGHFRQVQIAQEILHKNTHLAQQNRAYFKSQGVLVLNILSAPGSGKTALIERMLESDIRSSVIVGDLETDNDAQRLRSHGIPAIQITTGTTCHLEADMIARAVTQLNLDAVDVLIIENVGNLVCPAAYDLGENLRVVLLSVTEGEDKPLKYPTLFKTAQVVIVNKIDLAPAVEFDREQAIANLKRIAPQATIFTVSAKTGQGMADWYTYLEQKYREISDAKAS